MTKKSTWDAIRKYQFVPLVILYLVIAGVTIVNHCSASNCEKVEQRLRRTIAHQDTTILMLKQIVAYKDSTIAIYKMTEIKNVYTENKN